MPRYRTTFSSTVKPETLTYLDSKTDKSKGISRGDVMDSLVDDARQREKGERAAVKKTAKRPA